MKRYYESNVQDKGARKVLDGQHLVRANTFSGEFGSVYVVGPDGSAQLWERSTRWEPAWLVRARAQHHLGAQKGVA